MGLGGNFVSYTSFSKEQLQDLILGLEKSIPETEEKIRM